MGLLSSSKSSSNQTVQSWDERFGASENSTAFRIDGTNANIVLGSDELAALSLENSKAGLTIAADLIRETLGKAFSSSDNRASAAENNLAAAQAAAKETIQKGQESADDRLIKIFMTVAALAAFYVWRKR